MKTSEELKEIAFDALREMYSEAEPPLDFDYALENPGEMGDEWCNEHVLPSERQKEILHKHTDGENLNSREMTQVTMTAILDLGPASTEVGE